MTYYQETVDKSKFRYEAMTYTRSSIKSRTTAAPVCTFSLSLSLSLCDTKKRRPIGYLDDRISLLVGSTKKKKDKTET